MAPILFMELRAEQREIIAMCLPALRYQPLFREPKEAETISGTANESKGKAGHGRIREAWAQSV